MKQREISTARRTCNITQSDFADMVGCDNSYMSLIESGKRVASAKMMERIAGAFDVLGLQDKLRKEAIKKAGLSELPNLILNAPTTAARVAGVGVDAPTTINDKGGKQSANPYRFDLLDPLAMFEMTKVLDQGAKKYGADNWRQIDVIDHLNHLIVHAYAYLAGDTSDEHLSHIMCRSMFAQGVALQSQEYILSKPRMEG